MTARRRLVVVGGDAAGISAAVQATPATRYAPPFSPVRDPVLVAARRALEALR